MALCKFCGREIDWATTPEGRYIPVDPEPVFVIEGSGPEAEMFLDDIGAAVMGRQARPEEERRDLPVASVPHMRTCQRLSSGMHGRGEVIAVGAGREIMLGDVPRIELFARQRADGWDAWGNEAPEE